MPQIKTSLKELFALFVQSAQNEQLDMPSRRLAAQMTVTVAHIQRIEAKLDLVIGAGQKLDKKLDESVAELAGHILRIDQKTGGAIAPTPTDGSANGEGMTEDESAEEMANRVMAETQADLEAARKAAAAPAPAPGNGTPAAVTPIRQTAPVTQISPKPESAS